MTTHFFIGVDGGATKTHVRVENETGELIGEGTGGPANIRLSIDQSWESIYSALEAALKSAHIHWEDKKYQFHIGMGLAGCEVTKQVEQFLARQHAFSSLKVVSDAYTACLGAHAGKDGAIIIVGTGVVGYQIQHGKSTRVGGWGFPHGDEGGGAWLGLEAVRLTFHWLDGRADKALLVQDVFAFFNEDIEHMTAWANTANSSEFARLAPLVISHAERKEPTAMYLMKRAAQAVDQIGMALIQLQTAFVGVDPCVRPAASTITSGRTHGSTPTKAVQLPPCSLIGGIAPFLEPWLSDTLRACLVPRKGDPSQGALLLIREQVRQA